MIRMKLNNLGVSGMPLSGSGEDRVAEHTVLYSD